MVKKLVTGFAVSLGAGLALAVTLKAKNKNVQWRPAKADSTLTPVTIRVHTAALHAPAAEEFQPAPDPLAAAAELAEIKAMVESLDLRTTDSMTTFSQRLDDLQSHLPRFIDVKVTARIRDVEERLRSEFQDEQSKTLDTFLRTLEHKILPRLSLLEEAVGVQAVEIGQMGARIDKTEENLDSVLERIEKVVGAVAPPFPEYPGPHVTEINQKAVA